jgi:hypothetical protein|tara:strand:- start:7921 stop:8964 length:1044 start_codon:yes stop_codon:yes gene_type:complete
MRILYGGILALILFVGGYVFWWNHVAEQMLIQAERWQAARTAEGYEIRHKPLTTSGFPYRVAVTAEDLSIANPGHEYAPRIEIPRFWAIVQPWRINHVIYGIEGTGKAVWQEKGATREVTFTAASVLGSATFNLQGRMQTAALDIKELNATPSWRPPVSAGRVQLHGRPRQTETEEKSAPEKADGQQIALRIHNLVIDGMEDFPLGSQIADFALSSTLYGTIRRLPAKDTLAEWRDAGGYVDIEALQIGWGQGALQGEGRVALDEQLRPQGAVDTRISGYREILAALIAAGQINPDAGVTIGFGLDLLAREDDSGRRYIGLPLSAQNGRLYLGPVYLMNVPAVTGES